MTTNDPDGAALVRNLRVHGASVTYRHERVGGNFRRRGPGRGFERQAPRLTEWTERRRAIAARYRELLGAAERECRIVLPAEAPGRRHVFHQYVVRVPDRDGVKARLAARGIASAVFYPIPLHLQDCFAELGCGEGDLPESEKAAKEVLALPVFPELTDDEVERVATELLKVLADEAGRR